MARKQQENASLFYGLYPKRFRVNEAQVSLARPALHRLSPQPFTCSAPPDSYCLQLTHACNACIVVFSFCLSLVAMFR